MATHAMDVRVSVPGAQAAAGQIRQVADAMRQLRLQQQQARAQTANVALQAAQLRFQQQQERAARSGGGTGGIGAAVSSLVSSTRVNLGPVSPLVGRALTAIGAMGPVGKAAAVGLALATAGLASANVTIKRFDEALADAATTLTQFSSARIQTGGTSGNIAFLRAFGINPEQIPGVAGAIRGRLASSPFAQAAAHGMGIGAVVGRDFQPGLNEAGLTQKVIEGLAGIENSTERFKRAMQLDAVALLPAVEFYRRHTAAVQADARVLKAISEGNDAAEFSGQLERVKVNFEAATLALAKPFLKPLAEFLGRLADRLRDLSEWFLKNEKAISGVRDALYETAQGFAMLIIELGSTIEAIGNAIDALEKARPKPRNPVTGFLAGIGAGALGLGPAGAAGAVGGTGPFGGTAKGLKDSGSAIAKAGQAMRDLMTGGALKTAVQANTEAILNNTRALRQGTFGGGERTRRALQQRVPGIYPAGMFDRAVAGDAYRLGAF